MYFLGDPAPEERLVAVFSMGDFTFYGDESYGHEDAYAVAGYVASVGQWEGFIKQWKQLAHDEGFTILHKTDLENNVKGSEFEWPELTSSEKFEKKTRINKRACSIILSHALGGVGQAVQRSEWQRSITEHKSNWPRVVGRSFYAAGVIGCLDFVAELMERKRRVGMVRYVFEDKKRDGRGEAEDLLRELKADPRTRDKFRIAGYSFERKDDPEFIPLQAADFLAYESYRQIDNQILGGGFKVNSRGDLIKPRGALRCLLRADDPQYKDVDGWDLPVPHKGSWMSAQTIRDFVAHVERGLGSVDLVNLDD